MTQRKDETREEYLEREKIRMRAHRADPDTRDRVNARRREWKRERVATNPESYARRCEYQRERNRKRRADPDIRECDRAQRRKSSRERWAADPEFKAIRRAAGVKRRRLKVGAEAEVVKYPLVWKRDDSMCQLCGEPVFMNEPYPHPYSPSLDHIVPLSRGGSHTYNNVQLAHLRCNIAKGARTRA